MGVHHEVLRLAWLRVVYVCNAFGMVCAICIGNLH